MALQYRSFTTALYLVSKASDNYECLRVECPLPPFEVVRKKGASFWTVLQAPTKGTPLSRLILGLRLGEREGYWPLDVDTVPGVDWNELVDRNGFSKLHKIVYGISSQRLDAEIEARPENLDKLDGHGLTALWYACWLGNRDHIRILIHHGADVNGAGIPPICAAVWSGSYDSVEQLLNAGAVLKDWWIDTLYQTLMYRRRHAGEHVKEVLAIDRALFGQVFNINYRPSVCGQAPPMIALARQRLPYSHARMRQLLEFGADTELADKGGLTPLHHAIGARNTECCKLLGRAGANANVRTDKGSTILHTAIKSATHADILQAVSELDLSSVALGAKDNSGCTAFELFEIRAGRHQDDENVFPGIGYNDEFYGSSWWDDDSLNEVLTYYVENIDTELQILLSFQNLLQQVQEGQGVPIEDRYPLLNLTRESIMIDQNEDMSPETVMPSVPGAWPKN